MPDDIVTRLRGEMPKQTKPCIRGNCCEVCESILDSAKEAANEIEELRADNRRLRREIDMELFGESDIPNE